ncbi:MAG: single-strand DNA-binding protein [Campylobacterota bacterium]|nr:single-strand DNA-binding protein [Campylobacterota bacterium]
MYNKVVMLGHLTRDIELRYTQGAMAIANTGLATSRKFKAQTGEQKEEVCFIDITFFARSAEIANQYLRKGSKILVEGRLNFEQWSDQNGAKRSKHTIVVESMQMLDSKNTSVESVEYKSVETTPPTPKTSVKEEHGSFDVEEDEIPF